MSELIIFRGLGEGVAYRVERYSTPQPALAPPTFGDGHCDIATPPSDGDDIWGSIPLGDVDLGIVTATSSDQTLVAPAPQPPEYDYAASRAGAPFAFGETFNIVDSAGALATVTVPSQVFPIPSEVETSPGPLIVTWSGGTGAQFFHVRIQNSDGNVDCYPSASETSFTVPSQVMAILPARVTPLVSAEAIQYLDTDAGPAVVRVSSDNLD